MPNLTHSEQIALLSLLNMLDGSNVEPLMTDAERAVITKIQNQFF